jgi:hypothetical protein
VNRRTKSLERTAAPLVRSTLGWNSNAPPAIHHHRLRLSLSFVVMLIEFDATEMGFNDGVGGASNAKSSAAYHYFLFGKQVDPQHSWNSGIYFEFDGQQNGGVNRVASVILAQDGAQLRLHTGDIISVRRTADDASWQKFIEGVDEVFEGLVERKA